MRSKLLIVLGIVAGVIAIGVGVGYLAGGGSGNPPPAVSQGPVPTPVPTAVIQTSTVTTGMQPMPSTQPQLSPVTPILTPRSMVRTSSVALIPTNAPELDTNWEDKIDGIIGSDDPDTNKVKQLFALFPKLPPDGQEDAVQHLSNLVEDENYAPLGELLKDAKLPEGVQDELLADVLNRPNSLKLPLLLDVAGNPDHSKHDEAKDLLELYLGEDYGTDFSKWKEPMTNWLQQNPD